MSETVSEKVDSLRGDFMVAADKSVSHRALMLGAVADGATEIRNLLESEDVLNTAN
ncbi:MAG TPA: 3-phosphoshikimate 1-carboxyvinyltransferase, partial [Alphaproteobacteria bacterium]|nr:3-phosphoshikimate 1-carboxyvinyltransferase [Alphaproteobacteria bacterium]